MALWRSASNFGAPTKTSKKSGERPHKINSRINSNINRAKRLIKRDNTMKFVCALSALLTTATFLSFSPAVVVTAQDAPATVVDIAVGSEDHTILVQAVTEAGMVEALQTGGPITGWSCSMINLITLINVH